MLEHIRRRPGIYIGSIETQGLHRLVEELLSNTINEVRAGFCTWLCVELLPDGGCRVSDNGRGIPVDPVEGTRMSVLEAVLTTRGPVDGTSRGHRGLFAVGLPAVNVLSERLEVEVQRDGKCWRQAYSRGKPIEELRLVGDSSTIGTTVTFWPDPEIFSEGGFFSSSLLTERLRGIALALPGLQARLADRRKIPAESEVIHYSEGVVNYVKSLVAAQQLVHRHAVPIKARAEAHEVEVAMQWTQAATSNIQAYANSVISRFGTHLQGLRRGVGAVLNRHAHSQHLHVGPSFSVDDWSMGLVAVVSVWTDNPGWESSAKIGSFNPEIAPFVQAAVNQQLADFLQQHPDDARAICEHVKAAQQARLAARQVRGRRRSETE
jgi:DNA gyrase subunit B